MRRRTRRRPPGDERAPAGAAVHATEGDRFGPGARRFGIVGKSRVILDLFNRVEQAGRGDCTVLVTGDTGTGKELVSRAIHECSSRRSGPFVPVNCAAFDDSSLLDAELFGVEKGAATGVAPRPGVFELAGAGTLFLDEVAEMKGSCQCRFLRVLDQKMATKVGGEKSYAVRCRVIAATNRDLDEEVPAGNFRQDLWYRLEGFSVHVPPLRDRRGDLPLLVDWFLMHLLRETGRPVPTVDTSALFVLQHEDWPGNVRQLRNLLQEVILTMPENRIQVEHVEKLLHAPEKKALQTALQRGLTERELTLLYARTVLDSVHGNQAEAARRLGIDQKTLAKRLLGD